MVETVVPTLVIVELPLVIVVLYGQVVTKVVVTAVVVTVLPGALLDDVTELEVT